MESKKDFWSRNKYAVVGHQAKMPFPRYTYQGLKEQGKTVYAIDPSRTEHEGDPVYADFSKLPSPVDAVVLELPNAETAAWVEKAAQAGIKNVWIHWDTETPEALEVARRHGMSVVTGTCALMYLMPNRFPHKIHRWISQWRKTY